MVNLFCQSLKFMSIECTNSDVFIKFSLLEILINIQTSDKGRGNTTIKK